MQNTITSYPININKPGAGSAFLKVAFITDLHNAVWNQDEEYLPDLIREEEPDLILCGGDMIVARPGFSIEPALSFMKKMLKIAPVYFAPGNHELRSRIYPETYGSMFKDFIDPLTNAGMVYLDNEMAEFSASGAELTISGLGIPREKYKRFHNVGLSTEEIRERIGRPDRKKVNVLLAHNPKFMDTYFEWGAELILCGHYHGGIARLSGHTGLISPGLMPFPGSAYGLFKKGRQNLIVSAGLGEHTIPIRIRNPRELVILELNINRGAYGIIR